MAGVAVMKGSERKLVDVHEDDMTDDQLKAEQCVHSDSAIVFFLAHGFRCTHSISTYTSARGWRSRIAYWYRGRVPETGQGTRRSRAGTS